MCFLRVLMTGVFINNNKNTEFAIETTIIELDFDIKRVTNSLINLHLNEETNFDVVVLHTFSLILGGIFT